MVEDLHLSGDEGGHAVHLLGTLHLLHTREHGGGLGLEVDAALLHQVGGTALLGVAAGTGDAHLEDADAVELHLLAELEVVLEGGSELVEDGLDVGAFHGALRLDVVGQLAGAHEADVVDGPDVVLAEGLRQLVGVTILLYFLTHVFCLLSLVLFS